MRNTIKNSSLMHRPTKALAMLAVATIALTACSAPTATTAGADNNAASQSTASANATGEANNKKETAGSTEGNVVGKASQVPTQHPEVNETLKEGISPLYKKAGIEGLTGKEIINKLDSTKVEDRDSNFLASVRLDELQLMDDKGERTTITLPAEESYFSFAPYVSTTHPCTYHSLTTCKGEFPNTTMEVTIINEDTGEAMVKDEMKTFDNGFIGVWLPTGHKYALTVNYEGKTATTTISNLSNEDATCITEPLQLS